MPLYYSLSVHSHDGSNDNGPRLHNAFDDKPTYEDVMAWGNSFDALMESRGAK